MLKWGLLHRCKCDLSIHKVVNMIHYIKKLKYKYHMIILIDVKKAFHKIQHPLIIKTFNKLGMEEIYLNKIKARGTWVAQLVECPTLVQVMILWFMGSSHTSGSVLTAQSLEPVLDSVSPSLSAPPLFMLCLSKMNKH